MTHLDERSHFTSVFLTGLRQARAAGLTRSQVADLLRCTVGEVLRWENGSAVLSQPGALYELLMLKTGQFSFERMLLWHPSCLDVRLPDGSPVHIHLPDETLLALGRFQARELQECRRCQRRYIGPACPGCVPAPSRGTPR